MDKARAGALTKINNCEHLLLTVEPQPIPPFLRECEAILVELFQEFGRLKGQNENFTKVGAFLYLRGKISQKDLVELTGLSQATISLLLTSLVDIGRLKKEFIPGTHTNIYSIQRSINDAVAGDLLRYRQILDSLTSMSANLAQKLQEGPTALEKGEYGWLLERLSIVWDFAVFIAEINAVLAGTEKNPIAGVLKPAILKNVGKKSGQRSPGELPTKETGSNQSSQIPLDLSGRTIAQKLLTDVSRLLETTRMKTINSACLAQFFLHRSLTYAQLKEATHYSSGAISECVSHLEELGFVYRIAPSSGPHRLILEEDIAKLKHVYLTNMTMSSNWKKRLMTMKTSLNEKQSEYGKLPMFTRISAFVDNYIEMFGRLEDKFQSNMIGIHPQSK